ncbi:MAG: hypothetical protein WC444_05990 [Candidatus Paceibacterota bacterium]
MDTETYEDIETIESNEISKREPIVMPEDNRVENYARGIRCFFKHLTEEESLKEARKSIDESNRIKEKKKEEQIIQSYRSSSTRN